MNTVPFVVRLEHTINLLREETNRGEQDWTSLIMRLEDVLHEERMNGEINE
jgi:hypothetical protein